MESAVAIRKHDNPEVSAVLKALDGAVEFDLLYTPPADVMLSGYEGLRHAMIWASERTGRPIPSNIQEVLRWLRDHFGPEAQRKAAIEKYRPDQASSEARWAGGTFRDSPSSGESST
jgi:hypothetical protein